MIFSMSRVLEDVIVIGCHRLPHAAVYEMSSSMSMRSPRNSVFVEKRHKFAHSNGR